MAVRGPSAWVVAAFAAVAGAAIGGPGPIRKILTHLGDPLEPPPVSALAEYWNPMWMFTSRLALGVDR
jgi:hypothetical protein